MPRHDLLISLAVTILIALFLIPTLINTQVLYSLPVSSILLLVSLSPALVAGIFIVFRISRNWPILWQFAKFAFVGVLNTAIDFGILNLLIAATGTTSGIGIIFINTTSFGIALLNSFFWNKVWVFSESKKGGFLIFLAVTLIGLGLNTGIVYVMTTFVPNLIESRTLWVNFAKVLATIVSLVWNFTGYKLIVFKK